MHAIRYIHSTSRYYIPSFERHTSHQVIINNSERLAQKGIILYEYSKGELYRV